MIGRGPLRRSHVLAVSVLTAGLVCAGFLTQPSPAYAGSATVQQTLSHVIAFDSQGSLTQHATTAQTVGAFLRERGVTIGARDYVEPALDTPLSDRMTITYRAAVPVTILTSHRRLTLVSSAPDVGALLEAQNIRLARTDEVTPALAAPLPANGTIKITRVLTWEREEHRVIPVQTIHRLDFSMAPGTRKVVSKGRAGERVVMVSFVQRDGGDVRATVLHSNVLAKPHPRIVAEGIGEYAAFERFAKRGIDRTSYIAASAMSMIATAYTAGCAGCSGITASGRPAGHGIVAVDPRVIPLGTRLYTPGYGFAIAGDTGGAIRGNRIDLGFNSLGDALRFGRREVTVYRLK